MMVLPAQLDKALRLELSDFEKERQMPYVTSIERIAREEGKAEGKAEGLAEGKAIVLLRLLTKRFKRIPKDVESTIRATTDPAKLDEWIDLLDAATLDDFRRLARI